MHYRIYREYATKALRVGVKGQVFGSSRRIGDCSFIDVAENSRRIRARFERKSSSLSVFCLNRDCRSKLSRVVTMGRKPAASKAVEEAEYTTLPENPIFFFFFLVYASDKPVAGQKTFGCYKKEFERIEWDDEERANYWLNQFGALTALKLMHIEPDLIAKLVNAYNPVSNRIDLLGFEDVLCESMIADCFNLKSEGIVVSRNPELPHEWISHCYPEYAVPEDIKKEYYVAARCVDPEWKNKISWVLRHVLGRAEGREMPKGVLAAMIQAEVEGEVVNWAAIVFERIRGELRRLKAIRKGDHLKCEAGPLLTMIAEYVAYQKKDKEKTQKKPALPAPPAPTVSPEIQEAVEETLAAAQFYIARRQDGALTGLLTTIPITTKVTIPSMSTVVSVVDKSSLVEVHPDPVAMGDIIEVAEPVVRVVAQNPITIADTVKEGSTAPEDKSSKTRSQYLREQLRETLPETITEDSSVLEATTSLVELAELVSETEGANVSTEYKPKLYRPQPAIRRTVREQSAKD
ncbi:hypothetical protein R1sor_003606 [Riccia sorocarpa]|uniref:Uncharacterized protein n=1 Tax=Riccia sorocarpa TaxID=122646 RepID=A0ABD3H605_9MARC